MGSRRRGHCYGGAHDRSASGDNAVAYAREKSVSGNPMGFCGKEPQTTNPEFCRVEVSERAQEKATRRRRKSGVCVSCRLLGLWIPWKPPDPDPPGLSHFVLRPTSARCTARLALTIWSPTGRRKEKEGQAARRPSDVQFWVINRVCDYLGRTGTIVRGGAGRVGSSRCC